MWEKKRLLSAVTAVSVLALLAGCGTGGKPSDVVILETEESSLSYELGYVTIGDIVSKEKMRCVYQQVNSEELSFSVSGRQISRVYVKIGDAVSKGDLLAELATGQLDPEIEEMEYQVTRNKLLIDQTKTNRDMEIRIKEQQYAGWQSDEAQSQLVKETASIRRRYQILLAQYEDDNAVKELRLKELKEQKSNSYLYAGMSGKVSFVKQYLEGSTCEEDKAVIRIIDDSKCIFVAEAMEHKDTFKANGVYEMVVSSGDAKGSYNVVPYQMDTWEDKMYFVLEDESEETALTVNTVGEIQWSLEEKNQVLTVPKDAIHTADGRAFVYVIGDNQIREVQWIKTGITGDGVIEVVDGLAEGDRVVLR